MAQLLPPIPKEPLTPDSHIWRDWFNNLRNILIGAIQGVVSWASINFTGSNITDIVTRRHSDLQGLQGGTAGQYYHLTAAQITGLGTVTNVTGSGNIASSGGATPNITFTGVLPIASGGSGATSFTANRIPYGAGTSPLETSADLTFDPTTGTVRSVGQIVSEVLVQQSRRVVNLFTHSEDFGNAAWQVFNATKIGATTQLGVNCMEVSFSAVDVAAIYQNNSISSSRDFRVRARLLAKTTPASLRASVNNATFSGNITVDNSAWNWYDFGVITSDALNTQAIRNGSDGASRSFYVAAIQLEDVTGLGSTAPSEYVSVGVLSAPYHGTGRDGEQYFNYANGNTVASNVVTEAQGAALSQVPGMSISAPGGVPTITAGQAVAAANGFNFGQSDLKYYEEGTWTPTDTSGAGLNLTITTATYTRVGRMVTLLFNITYPATASGATASIAGIPFVNGAQYGVGAIGYSPSGAVTYSVALNPSAYDMFFTKGSTFLTNTQLQFVQLIGSMTYFI